MIRVISQDLESLINNSELSVIVQQRLIELVKLHGSTWMTEIHSSDDRKGDGLPDNSIQILSIQITLPDQFFSNESSDSASWGLEMFLMDVEDWSDDDDEETLYCLCKEWVSLRIDFLRTIENVNATKARVRAYEEISQMDLGGEELVCVVCGIFFWDNLARLAGAERNFCSIDCQAIVETDCIHCGAHFVVGRAKQGWKNFYRLNSFCDEDCYRANSNDVSADRSYIHGIKLRLSATGALVDESITRREVFSRADGKCYLCGVETHWNKVGGWDPLLANVDHIHPVSKGGDHTWENVALACQLCNTKKGAQEVYIHRKE